VIDSGAGGHKRGRERCENAMAGARPYAETRDLLSKGVGAFCWFARNLCKDAADAGSRMAASSTLVKARAFFPAAPMGANCGACDILQQEENAKGPRMSLGPFVF